MARRRLVLLGKEGSRKVAKAQRKGKEEELKRGKSQGLTHTAEERKARSNLTDSFVKWEEIVRSNSGYFIQMNRR